MIDLVSNRSLDRGGEIGIKVPSKFFSEVFENRIRFIENYRNGEGREKNHRSSRDACTHISRTE